MRFLLCAWAAAALAAPPPAPQLQLIPAPAAVKAGSGFLRIKRVLPILLAPDTPANRFALEFVKRDVPTTRGTGGMIAGFVGQAAIDRELARLKLDASAARTPQGYVLHVGASGILVAASGEPGLFYGLQTLRQLARSSAIPHVTISDVPALRYRGLSVDISRGPIPTHQQLRELVDTMAEFKMNMLSLYMGHVFPYSHAPLVAPPNTGITPEAMSQLAVYARRRHVELVPQQQTFGHLHHMLKLETYSRMGERPHGSVLAAEDESAYQWIAGAAKELTATFKSSFLHIGSDETFELGQGRSRELVARGGFAGAYLHHMQRVAEMLRPLDNRLMFWGDMALGHPELLPKLPKELIAMTWNYDAREEFDSLVAPFTEHGFEFFVCPGLNNWFRVYPNTAVATAYISGFVRAGRKHGAQGMLNTHWNDEGEGLLNYNWYPIVFSVAASWQSGELDRAEFARNFDHAFHRSAEPVVARIVERFERAHALFAKAGLEDANERLFWMDTFSASGARKAAQAAAIASDVRLLAEQNLVNIAAAEGRYAVRGHTLKYLALASHRLNYIGMKVQFSRYIAGFYRQAFARKADVTEARRLLRRPLAYVEDLRGAILEIKALYREAWLAENQPYWLENVLVRYDAEALYWQNHARRFSGILGDFRATHDLPAPETLGLHFPERR